VVGSAGTVGTGAIDDLRGLADLCALNPSDLWFHVDGAIGAVARCSTRLRPLFAGLERADSIAFDLHKWLFVPYECGCILVRDGEMHRSTFAQPPAYYLALMDGGITPREGEFFFSDYTLELSRSMKSLKVWMTLKAYGIEKLGQIMEQNVDQAQYFIELIQQHHTEMEVLATGSLNIVCFRYRLDGINSDTLNKLNKRLLVLIQERGIAVVSPYVINSDTFAMRMCIMNHRTKRSDLDWFLEKLLEIGHELLQMPEFSIVKS
jgi:glutamate/tyrosine decarboxylase-like PLP-dependent enzyme